MIFKLFDDKYISCVLFFIKSVKRDYQDETILKSLGVNQINKLETKEAILEGNTWPKVCILDANGWICILDDFYGLHNIQIENSNRELLFQKLSKTYNEVIIIGWFSEVVEGFIFEYYKEGKLNRKIEYETQDWKTKMNVKKDGYGNPLKELPKILDFMERESYIKTVAYNFGISLNQDISKGRFYQVE